MLQLKVETTSLFFTWQPESVMLLQHKLSIVIVHLELRSKKAMIGFVCDTF